MRREETEALTRQRAAPRQATGTLRTGRCSPSSPWPRRRAAPRPPGGGEARAELRSPAPLPSARRQPRAQPGSPPSVAPEPPECRARLGPRDRHPERSPGLPAPSGGEGTREPGSSSGCFPGHLVPCVRESLPSPLNSFLPSPRTTWPPAHYSLRRGRGGPARRPPYLRRTAHPPPSPPTHTHYAPPSAARAPRAAPHWPRRAHPSARTAAIGLAAPSFDLPTPHGGRGLPLAERSAAPPPPSIGERRRPLPIGSCPPSRAPPRPPRALAPPSQVSPQQQEGGGGSTAAVLGGTDTPSPAPPRLISAVTPSWSEHHLSAHASEPSSLSLHWSTVRLKPPKLTSKNPTPNCPVCCHSHERTLGSH